jgi:hypothetical protein
MSLPASAGTGEDQGMSARSPRPAAGSARTLRPLHDDTIEASSAPVADHACCCPARPLIRVTMPPSATRRHSMDLLLCGHHYRTSRQALAAAGATVTVLPSPAGSPPTGLLPALSAPRVPVS